MDFEVLECHERLTSLKERIIRKSRFIFMGGETSFGFIPDRGSFAEARPQERAPDDPVFFEIKRKPTDSGGWEWTVTDTLSRRIVFVTAQ
jgi:hypothetical protein